MLVRWLPDGMAMKVRKASANKCIRMTWIDGETSLEVYFWQKGPAKSQVVVQHSKLADAKQVERKKAYWSSALQRLRTGLENDSAPRKKKVPKKTAIKTT